MALSYTPWLKPKAIRQVAAHENAGLATNSPSWSNLSGMLVDDGIFSTVEWPTQTYSYIAIGYNFGFNIPTDSIIRGFQSRARRISSRYNWPSEGVTTSRLFVTNNATNITNLVTDNNNIQYTFASYTVNTDNLWTENAKLVQEVQSETDLHQNKYGTGGSNISWSPAAVNSGNFGYGYAPTPLNMNYLPIAGGIDYFEVRVIYEIIESLPLDGSMLMAF